MTDIHVPEYNVPSSDHAVIQAGQTVEKQEKIQTAEDGNIHLSSGVILKPKKVSPYLMRKVDSIYNKTKPKVPTVWLEDKQRHEENPAHPDYVNAMDVWEQQKEESLIKAVVVHGTKPLYIPDEIPSLNDNSWVEEIEFTLSGEYDLNNSHARYYVWLMYIVLEDAEDIQALANSVLATMGVRQEDVADQMRMFPDKT